MGVSVVIPVLNEAQYIAAVLMGLFKQDFCGQIEVIVVDGCSTDGTAQIVGTIAAFAPPHITVRLLNNFRRTIPSALNLGINTASSDIIVRLDGHTLPTENYISKCIQALQAKSCNAIVGGVCQVCPGAQTIMAKAIAVGVAHRFGIGNAAYRTCLGETSPREVDTVPFGAYSRNVWSSLGGYDEMLLTAEDYDFNYRAKREGISVWLLPDLVLKYNARPTLNALIKQYFRYGYWSGALSIKHKRIPAFRKAIPALFCVGLLVALAINPFLLCFALSLYAFASLTTSVGLAIKKQNPLLGAALLLVFPALHFSYGAGSLLSLHRLVKGSKDA